MFLERWYLMRGIRNYEQQDFTDLLNELQGIVPEVKNEDITSNAEDVAIDKSGDVVNPEKRRRASLMDNPKMLYAYSDKDMILHDRDCSCIKEIPDNEFYMLSKYDFNMNRCPLCYRKAIIRSGIGDDARRIGAYVRFFDRVDASNRDLALLLVNRKGKATWINNDIMEIFVNDDSWQIVCSDDKFELHHNNYIKLEDGSRHFTNGFHKQVVYGQQTFHNFLNLILSYSWHRHLENAEAENNVAKLKKEIENLEAENLSLQEENIHLKQQLKTTEKALEYANTRKISLKEFILRLFNQKMN
jgi:hypothetical protein